MKNMNRESGAWNFSDTTATDKENVLKRVKFCLNQRTKVMCN